MIIEVADFHKGVLEIIDLAEVEETMINITEAIDLIEKITFLILFIS